MTKQIEQFNPEQEAILTYVPDFQDRPFTITGLGETLQEIASQVEATAPMPAVTHVEAPKTAPKAEMVQVTDLSLLAPREVLRRKIQAAGFDLVHRTNMLGLFTEKLEDDRNLAMAQKLGIVSTVHCARHQKAVDKLKALV